MLDMLFIQIIIFKFYYKFEEITRNESLILSKRTKISTSKIYNQVYAASVKKYLSEIIETWILFDDTRKTR